jgi:RNA polymerase sigma-70 factor (ECF subfamily)
MDGPGSPQLTRPSLLIRIRDPRDSDAWVTFVDTYLPLIYRYARRMGLQDADAADVSQEVLTEVARRIRAFEYHPDRGRFRDWLGILVRRRVIRYLKKKDRSGVDPGEDDPGASVRNHAGAAWTDAFNAQILGAALERARPHFEPVTWQAFERVWLEDRRASEVAAELQMPIETIYTAKSRVLKRLAEEVRILAEDVPQLVPLS